MPSSRTKPNVGESLPHMAGRRSLKQQAESPGQTWRPAARAPEASNPDLDLRSRTRFHLIFVTQLTILHQMPEKTNCWNHQPILDW